jgi:hypothetical protein
MPTDWHDIARTLLEKNPGIAGRILHDLMKVDLPPVIHYTVLTLVCGDREDPADLPLPEMVILAGPPGRPERAIVVDFLQGRDNAARDRWPQYAAAVWLTHRCPVDLLVFCPDELTAYWANRPVATPLNDYVCHPAILVLEDLGLITS